MPDTAVPWDLQQDIPLYRSHKEVKALKIAQVEFGSGPAEGWFQVKFTDFPAWPWIAFEASHKPQPSPGWYYVLYRDGYESFSPADVFEGRYTRL
jgi:hypothetical protein